MLSLSEVESFGAIDADADELLATCFSTHPAYTAVREFKNFLVLGRKGSGKTAIYRQIVRSSELDVVAVGHAFDDYPWHHHQLQQQVGVPEERRYVHSWRYLILLSMAKLIIRGADFSSMSDDEFEAVSSLESFVVDSYGSKDPDMSTLFNPGRRLKFNGGFSF